MHRRVSAFLLTAVALAYFGSLIDAARTYPGGYDWRHTVASNLANPVDNPRSWRVAADGIAATGVLIALLGLEVRRSLRPFAQGWTAWTCGFFGLGGTLLMVSALILPGHHALFGLAKAHAKIAQAATFILNLGMACAVPALLRLPARIAAVRAGAIFFAVGPTTFYLLSRIFVPPTQGTVDHTSIFGSLAFWEWIGAGSVFAFMGLVTLAPRISLETRPATPGAARE